MAKNENGTNGDPGLETMSDFGFPPLSSPSSETESRDRRKEANTLISKIKVMILAKARHTNERQVISDDLDELFIEQSTALAVANSKVEALTLQLLDTTTNVTFADATRTSAQKEQTGSPQGGRQPPEKKGKTRTPGVVTDHVLLIYPKDKGLKSKTLDKRLTKAISPHRLEDSSQGKKASVVRRSVRTPFEKGGCRNPRKSNLGK